MPMRLVAGEGKPVRLERAMAALAACAACLALSCAVAVALALACGLGCPAVASADEGSAGFVWDECAVLSADQSQQLSVKAQEVTDDSGIGVYLLFCDTMNGNMNPTSRQRTDFAVGFYESYGLGLGSGRDGLLLVVAVESRDYVTVAYGQGSYAFTDEGIASMEDAVTSRLADDEWFEAAVEYYDQVGIQLGYYGLTGKPYDPDALALLAVCVVGSLVVAAVVAGAHLAMQRRKMKTAVLKEEASAYLDPSSVTITESSDMFVNSTMAVVPRVQSSGGGGHGGGGGGWGGGSGGGFSSSGGGKF